MVSITLSLLFLTKKIIFSMTKWVTRVIVLLVIAGVIGLLAYNKITKDQTRQAKANDMRSHKTGALMVDGFVATATDMPNEVVTTGTLLSNELTEIRPEVSGRITHIYFHEGNYVKKGALLVKLFDGDLQAQVEKLKIQKALADTTLARQEQLLAIDGISRQAVDATRNQVATFQAQLDYYKAEISKTAIRAPFSGMLGLRQVSEGAIVSPSTLITKIYQNNPLKLEFSIPEEYANQVKEGDKVSFTTSAYRNDTFNGAVYAINPGVNPASHTLAMRARVPNRGNRLTPGAFASVHIDLREIKDAIMVPTQSLLPTTKSDQVVICENGKAKFVAVETGLRTKDKVQIISGVQAGDTVLTTGILQVQPGMEVQFLSITD